MASEFELVHIEDGCCTCESVYESVKAQKVKGAFVRSNWGKFFTSVPGIPFVADAVTWRKKGTNETVYRRGQTLDGFKTALRVLYELGHIKAGSYHYPSFFNLPPQDKYVVGPKDELPAPPPQAEAEEATITFYREGWTEGAKKLIAAHVKNVSASPKEIVAELLKGGHRKPGLTEKTLSRQMTRMVGMYYSEDELAKYREKHIPRSRFAYNGRGRKPKHVSPSRSDWTYEQDAAMVDIAKTIKLEKTGRETITKIWKKFKKLNLREVKTHQSIRHRLKNLAYPRNKRDEERGRELGVTPELWHRLNRTRKHPKENKSTPVTTPPVNGVVTLNVRGLQVALTPEQQKQALEECLSEEAKKSAFEKFVSEKLA